MRGLVIVWMAIFLSMPVQAGDVCTNMIQSVKINDLATTISILEQRPTARTCLDSDGNYPLHLYAKSPNNSFKMWRVLMFGQDGQVDTTALLSRNHQGQTPLMLALEKKAYQKIGRLLSHGEDGESYGVNVRDTHGMTPLHSALSRGDEKAVGILLSHGADPRIVNEQRLSALDYARTLNRADFVTMLIKAQAEHERKECKTAFDKLATKSYLETAHFLARYPKSRRCVDENGDTMAHIYATHCTSAYVAILLFWRFSGDLSAKNNKGNTPIMEATRVKNYTALNNIISYQISNQRSLDDLYVRNNDNETALHLAVRTGEQRFIQIFLSVMKRQKHSDYKNVIASASTLHQQLWNTPMTSN